MAIFLFILGLVVMVAGADLLVRGASRLAIMIGISPLVVGLTVVAFGTSAPEFAVSIKAAFADQANICVGNVVGSNIFNILFILGLSSIFVPLIVAPQLVRLDLPLVIVVSALTLLLGWDGKFGRIDGCILFGGLILYTGRSVYVSRSESLSKSNDAFDTVPSDAASKPLAARLLIDLALIVAGLVLLVLGAGWLVNAAITFARWLQVSELVIALTIVSIGTSLPEVVTSLVASLKGERDIAVGNVVGSNLFNLLGVLGLTAILAPSGIAVSPQALTVDIPIMIAVAVIAFPIFYSGGVIARWEGCVLLAYYVVYTLYLLLDSANDPRLPMFRTALIYGAFPLTIVALTVSMVRWMTRLPAADDRSEAAS